MTIQSKLYHVVLSATFIPRAFLSEGLSAAELMRSVTKSIKKEDPKRLHRIIKSRQLKTCPAINLPLDTVLEVALYAARYNNKALLFDLFKSRHGHMHFSDLLTRRPALRQALEESMSLACQQQHFYFAGALSRRGYSVTYAEHPAIMLALAEKNSPALHFLEAGLKSKASRKQYHIFLREVITRCSPEMLPEIFHTYIHDFQNGPQPVREFSIPIYAAAYYAIHKNKNETLKFLLTHQHSYCQVSEPEIKKLLKIALTTNNGQAFLTLLQHTPYKHDLFYFAYSEAKKQFAQMQTRNNYYLIPEICRIEQEKCPYKTNIRSLYAYWEHAQQRDPDIATFVKDEAERVLLFDFPKKLGLSEDVVLHTHELLTGLPIKTSNDRMKTLRLE